jgi:hypothetical protein
VSGIPLADARGSEALNLSRDRQGVLMGLRPKKKRGGFGPPKVMKMVPSGMIFADEEWKRSIPRYVQFRAGPPGHTRRGERAGPKAAFTFTQDFGEVSSAQSA